MAPPETAHKSMKLQPDTITAILAHKRGRGYNGTLHRARCCVHYLQSHIHVILANDDDHALKIAGDIAARIHFDANDTAHT